MGRTVGTLVVMLVATALLVPTAAGIGFGGFEQQSVDPDVVVMTADVGPDGTADWTVAYRIRLDDDNATQAFEDLQADIQANPSAYTDRFESRMQGTAGAAENATGREMAIENVTVSAREETFGQTYGVVTYRFRWTNFASAGDGRIEAGDALAGLFLDSQTSLTIRWPDDYRADRVEPQPDDRSNTSATWRGQQEFGSNEPRVVATTQPANDGGGGSSVSPAAVGALVIVLAVVALFAARRYGLFGDDSTAGSADTANTEPTASDADGGGDAATAAAGGGAAAASEPPEDLLSNEEQVLKLLEANGGRIKQQRVAGELDWTDAKTSQVIGGLREDDEVETFRIGRENVVTLPDTDVTGGDADASDNAGEPDK
jgi:hypothetical protein